MLEPLLYYIIAIRLPVVLHKAVAEVSRIGQYREVSCCDAWMAERIR